MFAKVLESMEFQVALPILSSLLSLSQLSHAGQIVKTPAKDLQSQCFSRPGQTVKDSFALYG